MQKNKKIDDVEQITNKDIANHLNLPPVKLHCSMLAEEGIKKATQIQKENTLLDVNKLFKVHYDFHQEIQKKQAERNFNEETEEMASIISKQKLPN